MEIEIKVGKVSEWHEKPAGTVFTIYCTKVLAHFTSISS